MSHAALLRDALGAGEGVVRLAPCWVPRSFLMPGGRLKLDPRDLYALGAHRGGIDERWFASTTKAMNGDGTPNDEGLSYIAIDGQRVLLKEAIETRAGGQQNSYAAEPVMVKVQPKVRASSSLVNTVFQKPTANK